MVCDLTPVKRQHVVFTPWLGGRSQAGCCFLSLRYAKPVCSIFIPLFSPNAKYFFSSVELWGTQYQTARHQLAYSWCRLYQTTIFRVNNIVLFHTDRKTILLPLSLTGQVKQKHTIASWSTPLTSCLHWYICFTALQVFVCAVHFKLWEQITTWKSHRTHYLTLFYSLFGSLFRLPIPVDSVNIIWT